jgi:hypothetical protein
VGEGLARVDTVVSFTVAGVFIGKRGLYAKRSPIVIVLWDPKMTR